MRVREMPREEMDEAYIGMQGEFMGNIRTLVTHSIEGYSRAFPDRAMDIRQMVASACMQVFLELYITTFSAEQQAEAHQNAPKIFESMYNNVLTDLTGRGLPILKQ